MGHLTASIARWLTRNGHYLSTYCLHNKHDECRLTCKTCGTPCLCDCHGE